MSIPLVAFEEHYEAFFVWHHARDAGWLAESNNVLLHVDEHDDLRLPTSREELPGRRDDVSAARYTYNDLNISSFICPTVHAGIFDKLYWLRRRHEAGGDSPMHLNLSFDPQRMPLPWSQREVEPGAHTCEYRRISPTGLLSTTAPIALDIDLDYFAVNEIADRPVSHIRLDESFAREVIENPYHWMRVEGYPLRVEQDDNGHWNLIPVDELPRRPKPPDSQAEEALDALKRFGDFLDRSNLKPALITICRSEYSGSTPSSLTLQIETELRKILAGRFEIEEHALNDLLPDRWKVPHHLLRSFPW